MSSWRTADADGGRIADADWRPVHDHPRHAQNVRKTAGARRRSLSRQGGWVLFYAAEGPETTTRFGIIALTEGVQFSCAPRSRSSAAVFSRAASSDPVASPGGRTVTSANGV